jgi:hypothetical protein
MIPNILEPEIFGWDKETVGRMALDEYGARVLAAICEAALRLAGCGNGKLVNYRQLPAAIWPALMQHWNVKFSPDDTARMLETARQDAKNPALPFTPGTRAGRGPAPPATGLLVQKWLDPVYEGLEARRQAGGFASAV